MRHQSKSILALILAVALMLSLFGCAAAPAPTTAEKPAEKPAEAPAEAPAEKTEFDVILKFGGQSKLAVVKLVKDLAGVGLKEAKEYVDKLTDMNFILDKIAKQVGVPESSLDDKLRSLVVEGKKINNC